jgi:hypothetical protein
MPSYEHILLNSETKKRLEKRQGKLKRERQSKQLGMSAVVEHLLDFEEAVLSERGKEGKI